MKSLRISTAATLLLMTALAPVALAVGDPNTDTGFGSAASRGPFGFSNNNDVIYDSPDNSYGVYRDANGALRDRGMIPDNLTTRVPEPTWEEAHRNNFTVPGGGAPGGIGGGGGFFGGGIPVGGFGGLAGIGGFGGGLGAGGLGGPGVISGTTGAGGIAGGSNAGFGGLGGLNFGGLGFAGLGLNTGAGRFLGPGTGFIPNMRMTVTNRVNPNGGNTLQYFQSSPNGPMRQSITVNPNSGVPGQSTVTNQFTYNGNTYQSSSLVPTASLSSDTALNQNFTSNFFPHSNNNFTNPFAPQGFGAGVPQGSTLNNSAGTIGGGFATGQASGNQRSVNYTGTQGGSTIGGGFATPATSGSERGLYAGDNGTSSIGGGFSTPATSGSQQAGYYPQFNNNAAAALGGFGGNVGSGINGGGFSGYTGYGYPGYGTMGGVGGSVSTGLAGISGATGNRAARQSLSDNGSSSSDDKDTKSDGSISRSGSRRGGYFNGGATSNGAPGGAIYGNTTGAGLPGATGFTSGVFGPITQGGGPVVGTMGARQAVGPGEVFAYPPIRGLYQRVYPRTANGAIRDYFNEMQLTPYVRARIAQAKLSTQSGFISGAATSGNAATDLAPKLSRLHLTPAEAIGRVTGCMRYKDGAITTFGSKGTLHLAADNSGSITFNSGEVLTFKKAPPAMRAIALRSTQIF